LNKDPLRAPKAMCCYDEVETHCKDTRGWSMRRGHGRRLKCDHGRESVRGRAAFARTVNVGKSRRVGCYSPGIFAMRKAARSCKNGKRRFERVKAKSWSTPRRSQHLRMYKGAALPECGWHELWEAPEPEEQVGGGEALAMLDRPPQRPWRRRRHRHTLGVGDRVADRSTGARGIITCRRYPFLSVRYDGQSKRGRGWHTSKSFTYLGKTERFSIGDIVLLCDDANAVERDLLIFNPGSCVSDRWKALAEMSAGCGSRGRAGGGHHRRSDSDIADMAPPCKRGEAGERKGAHVRRRWRLAPVCEHRWG
jgi:hypothetical protein